MSVRMSSMVWERYHAGGGDMLLALAIADHAHDDGTRIYPSVGHLAAKTRQSVRTVQYQLRRMEQSGWLILVNEGDGRRNTHREYVINPKWVAGADLAPPDPVQSGAEGGANDDIGGCKRLHRQVTVSKPSVNHHSARGSRLNEEWVLPKKFGDWALAFNPEWSVEYIREMGEQFRDHWLGQSDKKKETSPNWLARWRTWCRNDKKWSSQRQASGGGHGAWWADADRANAMAQQLGIRGAMQGESKDTFHARIRDALHAKKSPPDAPAPLVPASPPSLPPPLPPPAAAPPEARRAKPAGIPSLKTLVAQPRNMRPIDPQTNQPTGETDEQQENAASNERECPAGLPDKPLEAGQRRGAFPLAQGGAAGHQQAAP